MIASYNCHHELERRQLASEGPTRPGGGQLTSIVQRPDRDERGESRSASASSSEAREHLEMEEELEVARFKESRQKISATTTESSNQKDDQTNHKTNRNQKSNSCDSEEEAQKELSEFLAIEPDYSPEREHFSDPDFHDERPARRRTRKSRLRATSRSLDAPRESERKLSDSDEERALQEYVPGGGKLAQIEQACPVHESTSDTDRETILSVRSVDDERRASSSVKRHENTLETNQPDEGDNQDSRLSDIELERELGQTDEQVSCQWTASEACAEFFEDDPEVTLADDEEDKDDLECDENEDTLHDDDDDDDSSSREHTNNSDADEGPDIEETRPDIITCSSEASQVGGRIKLNQEKENDDVGVEISRVNSDTSEPVNQGRAYENGKIAVASETMTQVKDEDFHDSESPSSYSNSGVKIEKLMTSMGEYCAKLVELLQTEAIEQVERIKDTRLSSSDDDQECDSSTRQTFESDEIDRPAMISSGKVRQLCEQSCGKSQDDNHQEHSVKTKLIYTSSSFYDDAEGSFPTIEKQIDRCQMIARQLESVSQGNPLDKTAKQNRDSQGKETSPQEAPITSNERTFHEELSSQTANAGEKASLMFKSRRERMRHYTICSPYCLSDINESSGSTRHFSQLRTKLRRCNSEPLDVTWSLREQGQDTNIYTSESIEITASASNLSSGSSLTDTEYEAPLVGRRRRSRQATDAKFQSCADIGGQQRHGGTSTSVVARLAGRYKPFLDSTTLKDIERLREWYPRGTFNEHQSVSPELCKQLVEDLTQSGQLSASESRPSRRTKSRGAILFERRQLQSSDWIVGGPQEEQEIPTTLNDCPEQLDGIAQRVAQVQVVVETTATNEGIERMGLTENQREHLSSVASSILTRQLSRPSISEQTVMVAEQGCLAEETSELIELTPLIMSHQQPRLELATITRTPSFSASSRHIIDERDNLPSLSSSLGTTDDDEEEDNENDFSFDHPPPEQQKQADELTVGPKAIETMDKHHAYLDDAAIEHRALVSWLQPKDSRPTSRLFECQKLILPKTQYASLEYFSLDDHDDNRATAIRATECRPPPPPVSESQPRSRLPTLKGYGSPSDRRAGLSTRPLGDLLSIGDAATGTPRTAGCKQQRPRQRHNSGIPVNELVGRQGGVALENAAGGSAIDARRDDERARRRIHPSMASGGNKLPQFSNVGENVVQAAQSLRVCRCECTCGLAREAQQARDNDNHAAWKWSQQEQQQRTVANSALLFHSRPPSPATRVPSSIRVDSLQQTDYESRAIARTTAARELVVPTHPAPERANGNTQPTRWPIDFTGQHARVHRGSPAQLASVSVDRRPLKFASPRRPPEMGHDRGVPPIAPPRTATLARRGPPAVGVDGHLGVSVSPAHSSSLSTAALTAAHQAGGDPNDEYYSRPGGTSRLLTLIGNHSSQTGNDNRVPCYWPSIDGIRTGNATKQTTTTSCGLEAVDREILSLRVCVKTPMEAHRIVIERRPTVLRHIERH